MILPIFCPSGQVGQTASVYLIQPLPACTLLSLVFVNSSLTPKSSKRGIIKSSTRTVVLGITKPSQFYSCYDAESSSIGTRTTPPCQDAVNQWSQSKFAIQSNHNYANSTDRVLFTTYEQQAP